MRVLNVYRGELPDRVCGKLIGKTFNSKNTVIQVETSGEQLALVLPKFLTKSVKAVQVGSIVELSYKGKRPSKDGYWYHAVYLDVLVAESENEGVPK